MGEPVLGVYQPHENAEALALDAACAQGGALRLSFRRPTFHRRAESYPQHVIFTARLAGRMIGTLAAAVKPARLFGRAARAAFAFDLRVHPQCRGRGVATALARAGLAWAETRADLVYAYTVDDNRAVERLGRLMGMEPAGGYAYLACPTIALRGAARAADAVSFRRAHEAYLASALPADFRCDAAFGPADDGYVGSWILQDERGMAGMSAFSHRAVLAEVVERVPPPLRILRAASRAGLPWPRRWPRIPEDGEELLSWYLFDAFATTEALGRELLRHVAAEARRQGVDWCHLVHQQQDAWVKAVRTELPRLFAPVLRYRLLLRRFDGAPASLVRQWHVDVRDL